VRQAPIYALNVDSKTLSRLPAKSMGELRLSEPYDLEAWLASSGEGLFGKRILWIARQDSPSEGQRSDLVGVDEWGNLILAELKRGAVDEYAVTQALAYAAEYATMSASDLSTRFATHSEKEGSTGLVARVSTSEEAQTLITSHVRADAGGEAGVNESQIMILAGEEFSATALAICDYLNTSSGEASFSVECWRYGVIQDPQGAHFFVLEQILPPPNVRDSIDEKREAFKKRKRMRDPVRREFMRLLVDYLCGKKEVTARRKSGQSYMCRVEDSRWASPYELDLSVHFSRPRLLLPDGLHFDGNMSECNFAEREQWGRTALEFTDVDIAQAKFSPGFGDRLVKVVRKLKPRVSAGSNVADGTGDITKDGAAQRGDERRPGQ